MSTICKIAVPVQTDLVASVFEAFLHERNLRFSVTNTEWPAAGERDNFLIGSEFPSIFSVKQVIPEVTEIHFNSFAKLEELASRISSELAKSVVVNIYQSVSTASHWAFYANGKQLRMIDAGEGEVTSHSGDRFSFEGPKPGRTYEDAGQAFVCFDSDAQDWYNHQLGIPIDVYQNSESGWVNWILPHKDRSSAQEVVRSKPWWRIW